MFTAIRQETTDAIRNAKGQRYEFQQKIHKQELEIEKNKARIEVYQEEQLKWGKFWAFVLKKARIRNYQHSISLEKQQIEISRSAIAGYEKEVAKWTEIWQELLKDY
jgi:hypothetical protein